VCEGIRVFGDRSRSTTSIIEKRTELQEVGDLGGIVNSVRSRWK